MNVKKHSGELVPFNADALTHSLKRSGASDSQVERVYTEIKAKVYDGISTRELYELAFESLKKQRDSYAARYSLKKALKDLGPEGFYFEKWIGRLFAQDGYLAITSQTVQGHAVSHELDVVAYKDDKLLAVECKFRNDVDAKISVTTPMYFKSRFTDISGIQYSFFNRNMSFTDGWLVTNAYLTSDSKTFGEYYNLNLLSWDYPKDSSIKVRVDHKGLYPITCLTNLDDQEKSTLMKKQCILVLDLIDEPDFLKGLQIDNQRKKRILMEAQELINMPVEEIL